MTGGGDRRHTFAVDLRQLQYFVRIVELKSFTRAAEQLRIAQPALGLQIRNLEAELETQLLVRHSRGVEPTEAGLVLLERAQALIEAAEQTKQLLRDFRGTPRGKLSIGMSPNLGHQFSAALVVRCASELPDVAITIAEELSVTLVEWVRQDRLDLACIAGTGAAIDKDMAWEPLFRTDLYFIGAPSAMSPGAGHISFADVASHPLVLPNAPHGLRRRIEDLARAAGLTIHVISEVQSEELQKELVKQAAGYTILPYVCVLREAEQGTLAARCIVEPLIPSDTGIVYKERRPLSRAAMAVRGVIQKLVDEEIARGAAKWRPSENGQATAVPQT